MKEIEEEIGDVMESNTPGRECSFTNSLLALHRDQPEHNQDVGPEKFSEFMERKKHTGIAPITLNASQTVLDGYKANLAAFIVNAKNKNALGPCRIQREMLQVDLHLFKRPNLSLLWPPSGSEQYLHLSKVVCSVPYTKIPVVEMTRTTISRPISPRHSEE